MDNEETEAAEESTAAGSPEGKPEGKARRAKAAPAEITGADKLALVLEKILAKQEPAPIAPTEGLATAKIPNGLFRFVVGNDVIFRNAHGDVVDESGRILERSDVEGPRALADA